MVIYELIGILVVVCIFAVGLNWVLNNVTIKSQSDRYTYKTDEAGNEYVQDNEDSKGDEPDVKA